VSRPCPPRIARASSGALTDQRKARGKSSNYGRARRPTPLTKCLPKSDCNDRQPLVAGETQTRVHVLSEDSHRDRSRVLRSRSACHSECAGWYRLLVDENLSHRFFPGSCPPYAAACTSNWGLTSADWSPGTRLLLSPLAGLRGRGGSARRRSRVAANARQARMCGLRAGKSARICSLIPLAPHAGRKLALPVD